MSSAAYKREWCKANPERVKKYGQTFFEKHKDRVYAKNKKWRDSHPDYMKAYSVKWWAKNGRDCYYRSQYGISLKERETLLVSQNLCCAICSDKESNLKGILHVGHNHKTKKVRGLLCNECNHGIGNFKDEPQILRKAIAYLERWA